MIYFITFQEALEIHDILIDAYGGKAGLRDRNLLLSALEMPKASFDGKDLHSTLFDKAAAYLYHIARNHPFIDGNKRTAAALALTFLELNKKSLKINMRSYEELIIATAQGKASKEQIARFLEAGI